MVEIINQRLREIVKRKNIEGHDIYNGTKLTRQSWSDFINTNKSIPSEKLAIVVEKIPYINARWLLTGKGEMFEEKYKENDSLRIANDYHQPPIIYKGCNDPNCQAVIKRLEDDIMTYKIAIKALSGEKEAPPEKYVKGGVDKPRKTG
jgi:hypothetical protein